MINIDFNPIHNFTLMSLIDYKQSYGNIGIPYQKSECVLHGIVRILAALHHKRAPSTRVSCIYMCVFVYVESERDNNSDLILGALM